MKRSIQLLLLALFLVQLYFVFAPQPVLLIWPDSISYLGPAADAIELGHLTNWNRGGFLYPLMVWGMLLIAPEPWAIVLVQRLVTIATFALLALTFWLLWRVASVRLGRFWPIGAGLMALWLLTFILYPPVTGFSQSLMPETLFAFMMTLVLLGLVILALLPPTSRWWTASTWLTPFASVALAFVKPHWLFAAALAPLLVIWLAPSKQRRRAVVTVLCSLGLAVVFVVIPESRWQETSGARFNRVLGARSLFCSSADLMHRYLAPRVGDALAQEVDAVLAPLFTPEAKAEALRVDWRLLQFDADKCTHGAAADVIQRHFAGDIGAEISYYLVTYAKANLAEPTYFPKHLWRQLSFVAARPFNGVQAAVFLSSRYFTALAEARDQHPLFARWLQTYGEEFDRVLDLPTRHMQLALRVFFVLAGFTMCAASLACGGWLTVSWIRGRRQLSAMERAFAAILGCALALNLLIAVSNTFDFPRYSAVQTPLFALLGYSASLMLLVYFANALAPQRSDAMTDA